MDAYKTKCGIDPIPVNFYPYSEADVTRHLQNRILGFTVLVDYERWDGAFGNAYVRMRVCIPAKELTQTTATGNDFISRTLRADGAACQFREDIIKALEPFMYPKNMENLYQDPIIMKQLTEKGIDSNRLAELINFSKFKLSRDNGVDYWCIYLQPEKIMEDMTISADSGKLEGKVNVISVKGGKNPQTGLSEPIRWGVQQDLRASATADASGVTVDELFNHIM